VTRLILFNKPHGVLARFTDRGQPGGARRNLSDHIAIRGIHPAGRLDRDSEGLLLLTDEGRLQARIADPGHKLEKTCLVQVERLPDEAALNAREAEGRDDAARKSVPDRPARPVAATRRCGFADRSPIAGWKSP